MDLNYLFNRCHRDYRQNRAVWERSLAAYSGGREYIAKALIKHVSEIELEYAERLERAYYFNYPRKIAGLITQYIFSSDPVREDADLDLCEDASRDGLRINEIMRQASTMVNIFGSAWFSVEMPEFSGMVDMERKMREHIRPYIKCYSPLMVRDWAVGRDGKLEWVLLDLPLYDNTDPYNPPQNKMQRKLWTRDKWMLIAGGNTSGEVRIIAEGENHLGEIPVVHLQEADSSLIGASHWFADTVRISDAILNNESEAQMNVVKQLFGLLVISESFARQGAVENGRGKNGSDGGKFSHVLARSAAIFETPDEKGTSRYIAPSGIETERIREENLKLKTELFDVVGLTLRPDTKLRQTAEAKSWDYQNTRQFLSNRVDMLEQAELKCWQLMHRLDSSIPVPKITYNRDFSVIDLKNMIDGLVDLGKLSNAKEYSKEISRTAVDLLGKYKKIDPVRKKKIISEIDGMKQGLLI